MKVGIVELRNMVETAVRAAMNEAKKRGKSKEIPERTEKAEAERREKQVRATGYSHATSNDFQRPLGDKNLYKRQGASGMGGWTAEGREHLRKMVEMVVREEIRALRRR